MSNKIWITFSFVLVIVGVVALAGSGFLAVNKYFLQSSLISENKKVIDPIDKKLDSDKDGIPDKLEIEQYGTDPNKSDTDNDGYSDKTEIDGGYDPLKAI